jgi:hypothetical protein
MGVELSFRDLYTYDKYNKNMDISNITKESHIHGKIDFIIDGKKVPTFGHDDCISYWLKEFSLIINAFGKKEMIYEALGYDQGMSKLIFVGVQ